MLVHAHAMLFVYTSHSNNKQLGTTFLNPYPQKGKYFTSLQSNPINPFLF